VRGRRSNTGELSDLALPGTGGVRENVEVKVLELETHRRVTLCAQLVTVETLKNQAKPGRAPERKEPV